MKYEMKEERAGMNGGFTSPEGRLLIVDDDEMNLQVVKGLLKSTDVKLTLVTSGEDCLEKLEQDSFDMVFLDHMMPGMDGLETLERIREKNPRQLVIALTGSILENGSGFYKNAGFDDYLPKPVDADAFIKMVEKYLPKEKVRKTGGASAAGQGMGKRAIPQSAAWLYDVQGISVEDGLKFCGAAPQYIKFLRHFCDTYESKAKEIEDAFNSKDLKTYTLKVHALKGTARFMGAGDLSELTKDLEAAGNSGDLDKINADTDKLLSLFKTYRDNLIRIKDTQDFEIPQKDRISDAELSNACKALKQFLDEGNGDAIGEIITELKEYELAPKDKEVLKELETLLPTKNWEAMKVIIK